MLFTRPDGSPVDLPLPRAETENESDAFVDSLRYHAAQGRSWPLIARIHGLSLTALFRRVNRLLQPLAASSSSLSSSASAARPAPHAPRLNRHERRQLRARLRRLPDQLRTDDVRRWCEENGLADDPPTSADR